MTAAAPSQRRRGRWTPAYFLAPAIVTLLAVGLYPLLFAAWNSLHRYNLARPREPQLFIGFANYVTALTDPAFLGALGRTLGFLATVLPIQLALGLAIALLVHRPGLGPLKVATRLALVVPMATTYAVVGLIGRLMFNREFGVVNALLGAIGLPPQEWLGDPSLAVVSTAAMDVWQWTPFCALVLLAGLTMVPPEIEEAARLETTSTWVVLRHVQLPFLLPGITAIVILRTAEVLKLFDMVYTLTRGGPGTATELVSIYVQRVGFRIFDQGLASAQAILLLILTIVLANAYVRLIYREVGG